MELSREELELMRQWFDSVQDTNGGYLIPDDYRLAKRLYEHLGVRVPESIAQQVPEPKLPPYPGDLPIAWNPADE